MRGNGDAGGTIDDRIVLSSLRQQKDDFRAIHAPVTIPVIATASG
jgi:hypothetical protein